MSNKRFSQLSNATKIYVIGVVVAGAVAVLQSLYDVIATETSWTWTLLAILTLVSGSATVKLPSVPATISVSETFVFTSVLLFGASAGTLTVALDALVISFWSYRKGQPLYKIVFNLFALPLTIWIAAKLFFVVAGIWAITPLYHSTAPLEIKYLLAPLALLAVVYFALNSWVITFAIALERDLSPIRVWTQNFVWLSLNYFGGASVAALLVSYTRDLNYTYLALILPLLVVLYFTFAAAMGRVADANRHLAQVNALYMSTIETLAMAIDAKDQITHGHIRRVQTLAVGLAHKVGVTDAPLIKAIEAAALLHDMGKLAVPEYILNKPGPLTPAEFDKMKLHASVGADILSAIEFPYPVVPIVRHHHENWDGSGYPDGLAAANIPIGARILAVVDCFDALTSDRPYRPRLPDKEAIRILLDRRGTMYDPLIVDTFVRHYRQISTPSTSSAPNLPLNAISAASGSVEQTTTSQPLDEIMASTDETVTLFDLAQSVRSGKTLDEAGDLIANHLRRLVPYTLGVLFVYDAVKDDIVAAHATGDGATFALGLRIGIGQRLSGWVAATRQAIRNADPLLEFRETARSMSTRPRSCMSAPLVADDELVGVLSLYSAAPDAFTEEHQRILEFISRQVAGAIRDALRRDLGRRGEDVASDARTAPPESIH